MDAMELPRPEWTPLPARAKAMFLFDNVLLYGGIAVAVAMATGIPLVMAADWNWYAPIAVGIALAGIGFGMIRGLKSHRNFRWRLDDEGLGVRSGHLWEREVRMPIQRVQHLSLMRGPWQRARQLANLTVYTAGTSHSSVKLRNMDSETAEAIRAYLSARIDWVDE